jgi:ribosomal protein L34E
MPSIAVGSGEVEGSLRSHTIRAYWVRDRAQVYNSFVAKWAGKHRCASCERALEDVVSPCAEQEKERRVTLTEF